MKSLTGCIAVVGCLTILGGTAKAQSGNPDADWLKGTTEERLDKLAEVQPGLGTVMLEYSYRFGTLFYAAKAGDWAVADYQLKEMTEIQEVGENTRPGRAAALKTFEEKSLGPIGEAIKQRNLKAFNVAFQAAMKSCNECHTEQKYGFIHYQLPKASPSPLSLRP